MITIIILHLAVWFIFCGTVTYVKLAFGLLFSTACSYLYMNLLKSQNFESISLTKLAKYFIWLLKEIFFASNSTIKLIFKPNSKLKILTSTVETKLKNKTLSVIYDNSITLTPGTICVDDQENKLIIHALDENFLYDLDGMKMHNKVNKLRKEND